MIGQNISHYKILEKLGEGGMGVVYKAQDTKLDRLVALKFFPPHLTTSEEEKARFLQEAKAASRLIHPNICTIHSIEEVDEKQFIVMEYVDGQTLKKKIEAGVLKIEEAIDVGIQIAQGLAKAHKHGITHRDIKPANVLIAVDGQAKIVDFGLAKLTGQTKLTKAGVTLGTVAYMSPEQALGGTVDHRTDIWSFGVVLYEMLSGQLPFKSEYEQGLVYAILNENPPSVITLRPDIPARLGALVTRCLEKEVAKRYQDVNEVLADLYRVKGETVGASLKLAIAANKVRPFMKPAAAVLGVVFLIAGYFYLPFRESEQDGTPIPKIALAVMHFENLVDPEDKDRTGGMLTNLLMTSLSQLKALQVTSRERLQNIQLQLGEPDAKTLSPSLAAQVAQRAGVKAFVTGSVLQSQPRLAVTVRLVDVESGAIIASQRVADYVPEQIFTLVDTLAQLVMNDLKVASSAGERRSVADITTRSPAAYRAYEEGREYGSRFQFRNAKAAFDHAIELDSTFAEAYHQLHGLQYLFGDKGWRASLAKAVQLKEKTTETTRLRILSDEYDKLEDNPRKAIPVIEKLITLSPNEPSAYLTLAFLYGPLLEQEKEVEVIRRGLKVDPSNKNLLSALSYRSGFLNYKEEAIGAANEYLRLYPLEPNSYDTKGDVFSILGEYDSSRVWYQKLNVLAPEWAGAIKLAYDAMIREDYKSAMHYIKMKPRNKFTPILLDLHRGQLKPAREKLKKILEDRESTNVAVAYSYRLLIHLAYEGGDYAEMLALAREGSAGKDYLAWAFLKAGEAGETQRLLEELKGETNPNLPITHLEPDYDAGFLALEEGSYSNAVNYFRRAYRRLTPNRDPNLLFAICLSKNGEIEAAEAELLRLMRWRPIEQLHNIFKWVPGHEVYWPISQVKAWYWLGVVYEQQGEIKKAIASYKKFLDIWKDADFDSPELKNAKARLAELKGFAAK